MKYENLMLCSLFAACLLVCTSVLGSMLTTFPAAAQDATAGNVASALLASPGHCALPPDGVICPRLPG
jgi:hypothetical protein